MQLTKRTIEVVSVLFVEEDQESVKELLLADCSSNISGCSTWSSDHCERLWLSVLKLSAGNIEELYSAIALAQTDYRDLFMLAGFGHDVQAHMKWLP